MSAHQSAFCSFRYITLVNFKLQINQESEDSNDLVQENLQPFTRSKYRRKMSEVGFTLPSASCHGRHQYCQLSIITLGWYISLFIRCHLRNIWVRSRTSYKTNTRQGQKSSTASTTGGPSTSASRLVGRSGSPSTSSSSSLRQPTRKTIGQLSTGHWARSLVIFSMHALQSCSFCHLCLISKGYFCSLRPIIEGTRPQKEI